MQNISEKPAVKEWIFKVGCGCMLILMMSGATPKLRVASCKPV